MRSSGSATSARWRLTVLLALVAAFTALAAVIVTSDAVPAADLSLARRVQSVDFPGWTELLRFAAYLTDKPAGPVMLLAIVLTLWVRRQPTEAIVLTVAQTLYLPQLWMKELVHRARPTGEFISVTEIGDGFGFPSGHMTLGVAVYGTVAMIALVRLEPGWRRTAVLAACGAILMLSAISRPTFGAHWPSDALGGVLLGSISLLLLSGLYQRMRCPRELPRLLRRPIAIAEHGLLITSPQRIWQRSR